MGTFLSMTSVIGKSKDEVIHSLTRYAQSVNGGLEKANLSIDNDNCCVITEANGNTTVLNPDDFLEWDASSEFISGDLNAPVFSFHIHDGDLWMYTLFANGKTVDQFNPIPDYWEEDLDEDELRKWEGSATTVHQYIGSVKPADIEKYLVRWDTDDEDGKKAYPDDEYEQEDWQLLDFMRKLSLPYPLKEDGTPKGETFRLWTKDLPLQSDKPLSSEEKHKSGDHPSGKPWWKFW
jgi:hypothetical protein